MRILSRWLGSGAGPIGVDLGSDALKLAQLAARRDSTWELVAVADAPVPAPARRDPTARLAFFQQNIPRLLAQGGFRGRRAVMALPAACMRIDRLRMPRLDDAETRRSLAWEARDALGIDPARVVLRHVIAGEAYANDEPVNEVIVMAAARDLMERSLSAAAGAKLDVVGMTAEPQAIVECFNHMFAGTPQAGATRMIVDVGSASTRVYIARGPQLLFARIIEIGGDQLDRAVAGAMKTTAEQARDLRRRGDARPSASGADGAVSRALALREEDDAATATAVADPPKVATGDPLEAACAATVQRLAHELEMCLRYHETTFAAWPVEHLTFIGGEACNRRLCRQVAAHLGLKWDAGDPLSKFAGNGSAAKLATLVAPRPAWTVAVGLALGGACGVT